MINWLWKKLEPYVDTHITRRILLFHDAMVRRGQIKYIGESASATQKED